MSVLTDVKVDLLAINVIEDNPSLDFLLPSLLTDFADDLTGSGITSINVPLINISYKVLYGTNVANTIVVADAPTAPVNTIVVAGGGNDTVIGGFGDDILLGGGGNDVLMGFFGSNTLDGGMGDDHLFGVVDVLGSHAAPFVSTGLFQTSPNVLFGESGNDVLVGDVGVVTTTFISHDTSISTFGGNSLYGGDGNDSLYGTFAQANLIGSNLAETNATFAFASSYLDGGNGDDYIVGNVGNLYENFSNTQGNLVGIFNSNTLFGGAGNDTLIGNLNCDQTYTNCAGTANYSYSSDFLNGGSGDDLLIGDCNSVKILITNTDGRIWTQVETCGNDTLIGGSGNDRLIGDVNQATITIVGNSQYTYVHGNNILYGGEGDDLITGGFVNEVSPHDILGHNQFVYDGLINNGKDMITDFNVALDTLVGQHGATFTDGGVYGGNLVINVHDAGVTSTITLTNIHTDVFATIHQTHAVIV